MMTCVYAVSTKKKANKHKFKFGSHTGTQQKLLSRYTTYLINPLIYYFYETPYAKEIENIFKKKCIDERIINDNGKITEWIYLELHNIAKYVCEIEKSLLDEKSLLLDEKSSLNEKSLLDEKKVYNTIKSENNNKLIVIHKYTYYDINDLTLFQQYLLCTYDIYMDNTPYETIMKYFNFCPDKPQYHNINYPIISKDNVHVIDKNEWITKSVDIIEDLIHN